MAKTLDFPDDIRPDFQGFSATALTFLEELRNHNDRAWFKARKDIYDAELKFQMECLLGEFSPARRLPSFPVQGDPKRGIFRIYRDVRFSKNKEPYKTHVGAVMTRSGGKGDPGLIYTHIEPGGSFLSAGFYSLDREFLAAWRSRIAANPDRFLDIVRPFAKPRGKFVLRHRGALKTMPRGFQEYADSPVADYLKWKHFLIGRSLTDRQVQSRKLLDHIRELADVAGPFLEFGWDVLETAHEDDPRRHMRVKEQDK
tara:strand:- start:628 stop:1395 length:768 start_codon:yes stop_codon:yes gene_type:complete